jgi:hypothetical protein
MTIDIDNNIAVAIPLVLKTACRKGIMMNNNIVASNCNLACTATGIFCFLDRFKCRGNKVVVANGQTLRHKPVATTSNAGATGINIFQNSNNPTEGKNIRQIKMVSPTNQTRV